MLREHSDNMDIHFLRRNIQVEENQQDQLEVRRNQLSIAIKQNRKGVIRIVDTSKKSKKTCAGRVIKSQVRDIIKPGDKKIWLL